MTHLKGMVASVSLSPRHGFSKSVQAAVRPIARLGVEGDAHAGRTVQHRSRVAQDPNQANLRQVHLIHEELHADLAAAGFRVGPGELGENVTTRGIDLLSLPRGARLRLGDTAVVGIVLETGEVWPGDAIDVELPPPPHQALDRV